MIGRIAGTLLEKNPPSLLVDVQGVGYELEAPMSTFYELPAIGQAVQLLTHFVVREDAQLLFGFRSQRERSLFRALLKVNGVGARVALSILSGMSVDEFATSVARKDVAGLTRLPGVGKKTAERLLVEMQDKVLAMPGMEGAPMGSVASAGDVRAQATEALLALGYRAVEATRLLDKAEPDTDTVEALIKAALRRVSQ